MSQRWTAGQLWRRVHLPATIRNAQRFAPVGAERDQVVKGQTATGRLNVGRYAARQIALIEIARARRGKIGKGRLQSALRQPNAGLDVPRRVGLKVGGGASGI